MKTTPILSFLLVCIVSIIACKQLEDYAKTEPGSYKEKNVKDIQLPSPDSYLFSDVRQDIKDTILQKLQKNIQELSYFPKTFSNDKQVKSLSSVLQFVPVVIINPLKERGENDQDIFKLSKELVFFYEMENGELIYVYEAEYKDGSNFTKDTNPEVYKAIEEVFGKESAEQSVEIIRNKKGADCWNIQFFPKGGPLCELFEYALNQSDDGKVIVVKQGYNTRISFFKNGEFIYCRSGGVGQEIFVRPVRELIK